MKIPASFLIATFALAGCTLGRGEPIDGYDMAMQSDACRSDASAALPTKGADGTATDRQAAFDQAYRACMTAKGYPL